MKTENMHVKMGQGVGFERIRRITGYLVGTMDKWNDAKRAEERDRVKPGMLNLAGITEDSIVDGPGIRTTFYCQGCPHHCPGCHNPETWEFSGGTPMEESRLVEIVESNPLCHGVTFSGGEPFSQAVGFTKLAKLLKEKGYEVASYSGYTFEQLSGGTQAQRDLLSQLDVLIDGPFVLAERSLELNFRGSRNQRILNVPESLKAGHAVEETSGRWLGTY